MIIWNPWHGCKKYSEGCQHCYMYALDKKRDVNSSIIKINKSRFDLPIQKIKNEYLIPSGMELYVGLSTDFFIEEADKWRPLCWEMMRTRKDVAFRITTKRASRIKECLPDDWGDGYDNVMIQVTAENQDRVNERLPILMTLPIKHKSIFIAPMLGPVDIEPYLHDLEVVMCGGENYDGGRPCNYNWVKQVSEQCKNHNVTFNFIETGNVFINEKGETETLSKIEQSKRALSLGVNYLGASVTYNLQSLNLFDIEYHPTFSKCCEFCSNKLTCNGCGKNLTCSRNCP